MTTPISFIGLVSSVDFIIRFGCRIVVVVKRQRKAICFEQNPWGVLSSHSLVLPVSRKTMRPVPGTSRNFHHFTSAVPDSRPWVPSRYACVAWSENYQPPLEDAGMAGMAKYFFQVVRGLQKFIGDFFGMS